MQNSLRVGSNFWEEKSKTLVWKLKSKIMCFEKFLESFLCITCHEKSFENWFYRKISGFSKKKKKKTVFLSLDDWIYFLINQKKLSSQNLTFYLVQLMFDWSSTDRNWKIFSFLKFWPICFFHASFMIGFTCIPLFSVSILQFCSYISHFFHT